MSLVMVRRFVAAAQDSGNSILDERPLPSLPCGPGFATLAAMKFHPGPAPNDSTAPTV